MDKTNPMIGNIVGAFIEDCQVKQEDDSVSMVLFLSSGLALEVMIHQVHVKDAHMINKTIH